MSVLPFFVHHPQPAADRPFPLRDPFPEAPERGIRIRDFTVLLPQLPVHLSETLAAELDAVVRLIAPSARDHSTTIEVEPVAPETRVRADEAELQHVLLNLLLNAIQACGPEGQVRMEVLDGDPVCVRITDNGCGIVPEEQKRIFEPFFSLRRGGTGLGLFLSLNFVRRWGGDIQVQSAPGIGSTFEVSLPSAAAGGFGPEDTP